MRTQFQYLGNNLIISTALCVWVQRHSQYAVRKKETKAERGSQLKAKQKQKGPNKLQSLKTQLTISKSKAVWTAQQAAYSKQHPCMKKLLSAAR